MSGTWMFPFVITAINAATSVAAAARTFTRGPLSTCLPPWSLCLQAAVGRRIAQVLSKDFDS